MYTSETTIPNQYQKFAKVFKPKEADKLPPHRPYDLEIKLEEGKQLQMGPVYVLTRSEEEEAKRWIKKNLDKGFVWSSTSPISCPIMFVKKKDGSNCLCIDYRALNN